MSDHVRITRNRREFLCNACCGIGSLAFGAILSQEAARAAAANPLAPRQPHHQAKAKSMIFLFLAGGPSQVDTFDPKPELTRLNGQNVPETIARSVPRIARAPLTNLYASPYRFRPHGRSGIEVSELFPEIGRHVDDICVLRSCRHDSPIHAPAEDIDRALNGVTDVAFHVLWQ